MNDGPTPRPNRLAGCLVWTAGIIGSWGLVIGAAWAAWQLIFG